MTTIWRITITRGTAERAVDVAGPVVTIGRSVASQLRLAEDEVAHEHARLHLGEDCAVEACGAPVRVGGRTIAPPGRIDVPRGAPIVVGGWTLTVARAPAGAVPATLERTASLARELIRDLLGGEPQGGPVLQLEIGPEPGRRIALPPAGERMIIGRGDGATCLVFDPDLSRQHFAVDRAWDGVRVTDLGSKNGTLVAGQPAPIAEPGALLRDGELLSAGATRLRLIDPAERYLRELEARFGDTSWPASTVTSTPTLTAAPGHSTASARAVDPSPIVAAAPRASNLPLLIAAVIALAAIAALVALLV